MRRLAATVKVKPRMPITVNEIQFTCHRYVHFTVFCGIEKICDVRTGKSKSYQAYVPERGKIFEYDIKVYAHTVRQDYEIAIKCHGINGIPVTFGQTIQTLF